jgi:hypothetical protein
MKNYDCCRASLSWTERHGSAPSIAACNEIRFPSPRETCSVLYCVRLDAALAFVPIPYPRKRFVLDYSKPPRRKCGSTVRAMCAVQPFVIQVLLFSINDGGASLAGGWYFASAAAQHLALVLAPRSHICQSGARPRRENCLPRSDLSFLMHEPQ